MTLKTKWCPFVSSSSDALKTFDAAAKRAVKVSLVFSLGLNLLYLTVPIFMIQLFARVIPSQNMNTLVVLLVIVIFALLCLGTLDAVRGAVLGRFGSWSEAHLGSSVFSARLRGVNRASGSIAEVNLLADARRVKDCISSPGFVAILDFPWLPLFTLVMFLLHPWLGLLTVFGSLILISLSLFNEFSAREIGNSASRKALDVDRLAVGSDRLATSIRSMGLVQKVSSQMALSFEALNRDRAKSSDRAAIFSSATKFLRLALQVSVLAAGAFLAVKGQISAGGMVAGSIILARALAPLDSAVASLRGLLAARRSYRRIRELLECEAGEFERSALPEPLGQISLSGVAFRDPASKALKLNNTFFDLPAGSTLGIVGSTASGKSLLAELLIGELRPSAGVVRLDGVDVHEWSKGNLGRYVGYLPQQVRLWDATLAENIAGSVGEVDVASVVSAAKLIGAHEKFLSLPNGYDTVVSDDGKLLTMGLRQLIGIARAFCRSPRLLVLDDPTCHLDPESESALLAAIASVRGATTVVVISNRPGLIRTADFLLTMENGGKSTFARNALRKVNVQSLEAEKQTKDVVSFPGSSSSKFIEA